VSSFITGGNVVAAVFISPDVFSNRISLPDGNSLLVRFSTSGEIGFMISIWYQMRTYI